MINALAAHGLCSPVILVTRKGQADQAYGNNVYDQKNAVLDQLSNLFNNYLSTRQSLEAQTQNARLAALQNAAPSPDTYATSTTQPTQPQTVTQPTAATTVKKKAAAYNPQAYVPGGASAAVARAIMAGARAA